MLKKMAFSLILFISLFSSSQSFGQFFNVQRRVVISTQVFIDRMQSRYVIPHTILEQAQCIASLRNVKAGFIFGGEGSTGLVSCRVNGEWSAPSFLNTGGVSFGLLIGGQVVDNVLVFMTPFSRQMLNRAQLQLGADLSFAIGPVGQGGSISAIPVAHVLTYSAGTGLYAGLSLNGLVMAHGPERNSAVYGQGVIPAQILSTPARFAPAVMQAYVDALNYFAK